MLLKFMTWQFLTHSWIFCLKIICGIKKLNLQAFEMHLKALRHVAWNVSYRERFWCQTGKKVINFQKQRESCCNDQFVWAQFASFTNYGLVQVELHKYEFWINFATRFWKLISCLFDYTVVIKKIESILNTLQEAGLTR